MHDMEEGCVLYLEVVPLNIVVHVLLSFLKLWVLETTAAVHVLLLRLPLPLLLPLLLLRLLPLPCHHVATDVRPAGTCSCEADFGVLHANMWHPLLPKPLIDFMPRFSQ
jgi:hypothetical protein